MSVPFVSETVRQALGLGKRDEIHYAIRTSGEVALTRVEDSACEDAVLGRFLDFLASDIASHPERLQAIDAGFVKRLQALTGGLTSISTPCCRQTMNEQEEGLALGDPQLDSFAHPLFVAQIQALAQQVEIFKQRDPVGYVKRNASKRLAAITKLAFDVIPQDPMRSEYRPGGALSDDQTHWFRANSPSNIVCSSATTRQPRRSCSRASTLGKPSAHERAPTTPTRYSRKCSKEDIQQTIGTIC